MGVGYRCPSWAGTVDEKVPAGAGGTGRCGATGFSAAACKKKVGAWAWVTELFIGLQARCTAWVEGEEREGSMGT